MSDATETGRKLAEAAEEAAKSMQEFAELLRREDEEYDRQKFRRYPVLDLTGVGQEELIKARMPKPFPHTAEPLDHDLAGRLAEIGHEYAVSTDEIDDILRKI